MKSRVEKFYLQDFVYFKAENSEPRRIGVIVNRIADKWVIATEWNNYSNNEIVIVDDEFVEPVLTNKEVLGLCGFLNPDDRMARFVAEFGTEVVQTMNFDKGGSTGLLLHDFLIADNFAKWIDTQQDYFINGDIYFDKLDLNYKYVGNVNRLFDEIPSIQGKAVILAAIEHRYL